MKKTDKKLSLSTSTVRRLAEVDLGKVDGAYYNSGGGNSCNATACCLPYTPTTPKNTQACA